MWLWKGRWHNEKYQIGWESSETVFQPSKRRLLLPESVLSATKTGRPQRLGKRGDRNFGRQSKINSQTCEEWMWSSQWGFN